MNCIFFKNLIPLMGPFLWIYTWKNNGGKQFSLKALLLLYFARNWPAVLKIVPAPRILQLSSRQPLVGYHFPQLSSDVSQKVVCTRRGYVPVVQTQFVVWNKLPCFKIQPMWSSFCSHYLEWRLSAYQPRAVDLKRPAFWWNVLPLEACLLEHWSPSLCDDTIAR